MGLLGRYLVARVEGNRLMMKDAMWAEIPFSAAGVVFYIASIALVLRRSRAFSPARVAVGGAWFAYAVAVAAAAVFGRNANFWTVSICYWFPALVFLMGFGAVYKSVSLRILLDLLGRPGQAEHYSRVLARYVAAESFESRLEVMIENRFAVLTSVGYTLTDRGRRLAKATGALQKLFAIERSG